jgi:hypothetical protein
MDTDIILNIIEALVLLYLAYYGYRYYNGTLKLSERKEAVRKERVEKHGSIIRLLSVLLLFFGCMVFILSVALHFIRS